MTDKWISVNEQMPEEKEYVLAFCGNYIQNFKYSIVYWEKAEIEGNNRLPYRWREYGPMKFFGQDITHWMKLPSEPNGKTSRKMSA